MELVKGAPVELTGRMDREVRVYSLLDSLGVEYYRVDHQETNTMEACSLVDDVLGTKMCKNLFLCNRTKTEFYLLMMPDDKPFKTKDITKQVGCSRLSFGDSDSMLELLDIIPGAVSVLGLMNDTSNKVQLLIDKPIIESAEVGCHPCVSTTSLRLKVSDLIDVILPHIHHTPFIVDLPDYIEEEK